MCSLRWMLTNVRFSVVFSPTRRSGRLCGSCRRAIWRWPSLVVRRAASTCGARSDVVDSLSVPARRQHFHHFMRWVHKRMFELIGTPQPLTVVAKELAREVRVMCFDELFVTDIGDAVILGGLLQVMFEHGVVLVCTSNQPPDQLYSHGHNRERFLPAVAAIHKYMDIVAVDGGEDHRLHPGQLHQRYWIAEAGQPSALQGIFEALSAGQPVHDSQVMLGYRSINVVQHSDTAVWCRYRDLCEQPLACPV